MPAASNKATGAGANGKNGKAGKASGNAGSGGGGAGIGGSVKQEPGGKNGRSTAGSGAAHVKVNDPPQLAPVKIPNHSYDNSKVRFFHAAVSFLFTKQNQR